MTLFIERTRILHRFRKVYTGENSIHFAFHILNSIYYTSIIYPVSLQRKYKNMDFKDHPSLSLPLPLSLSIYGKTTSKCAQHLLLCSSACTLKTVSLFQFLNGNAGNSYNVCKDVFVWETRNKQRVITKPVVFCATSLYVPIVEIIQNVSNTV